MEAGWPPSKAARNGASQRWAGARSHKVSETLARGSDFTLNGMGESGGFKTGMCDLNLACESHAGCPEEAAERQGWEQGGSRTGPEPRQEMLVTGKWLLGQWW